MRASKKYLRLRVVLFLTLVVLAVSIFTANIYAAYSSSNQNFHPSISVNQSPESVVAAFDAALNAHDVNAALDLFADNGFLIDHAREAYGTALIVPPGLVVPLPATCEQAKQEVYGGKIACTYSGKGKISDWLRQLVVENIQVQEIDSYQASDNNVTWRLNVSIDGYRSLGVAPLETIGEAAVQDGKIQSLTLSLPPESMSRLLTAAAKSRQGNVSFETSGFLLGIISLALVLPAGAIYYVSRVKSLFAAIPRLERPWLLQEVGLASLLLGIVLTLLRYLFGLPPIWDVVNTMIFVVSTAIFLVGMVMMKRAWTVPSSD